MMFQSIMTQFMSGFSVVAILVIAAIGLAVVFGVAGVINMAHGEFIMVGAYTAAVVGKLGGNTFVAIPVAFVVVGLLGLVIERGIVQWIYDRPLETLLATWGVGIILQVVIKLISALSSITSERRRSSAAASMSSDGCRFPITGCF